MRYEIHTHTHTNMHIHLIQKKYIQILIYVVLPLSSHTWHITINKTHGCMNETIHNDNMHENITIISMITITCKRLPTTVIAYPNPKS